MRTFDEAAQALERTFPSLSIIVADEEVDYPAGTVEDSEESILASFQLVLEADGKTVNEIRNAGGQTYCGHGEPFFQREIASCVGPIQISRHDQNGVVWGLAGDYEVCIGSEQIKAR